MEAQVATRGPEREGRSRRERGASWRFGLLVGLLLAATFETAATATATAAPHAGALRLAIERLRVLGRVLYVAAHPDDENTFLLSWLVAERRVRAAYLSLTRGGGGQNLLGPERGSLFALLRTQELLAARALDGAEQLFTRARDFGYSRSAGETLRLWDRQAVLGDIVWALRLFRPDVVITRFAGDGSGRHGHHTASARLALFAFRLAADPRAYPEQVPHVGTWQAQRIVWNAYNFRPVPAAKLRGALAVDVGGYSPLLGVSYGELAARSRTMHKSQGFGVPARRGRHIERFKLLAGAPLQRDLLDGVDLSWRRVRGGLQVDGELRRALRQLRPDAPERAITALAQAGRAMRALPAHHDKAAKLDELGQAIAACAGLFVEARAPKHWVVAGGRLPIALRVLSRRAGGLTLERIRWSDGRLLRPAALLAPGIEKRYEHALRVPLQAEPSQPYWLRETPTAGTYVQRAADVLLTGAAEAPAPFAVELTFAVAGHRFRLRRPVVYGWTDRVQGERLRLVQVAPAAMVTPERSVLLFPNGTTQELALRVTAGKDRVQGTLGLEVPGGWQVSPPSIAFQLAKSGDEQRATFKLRPPRGRAASESALATAVATVGGRRHAQSLRQLDYAHITPQSIFPPAAVRLVPLALRRGPRQLAYVQGAGDEVAESLEQVGYRVTRLRVDQLTPRRLAPFRALVLGVRALNTHPALQQRHAALAAYVHGGGRVLMQYNTSNRWNRLQGPLGPYPLRIGSGRITDERAALTPVLPRHPVLDGPNKLGSADFDGWVQERGLYFAKSWDPRYRAVLRGHDPGRKPLAGSLLIARYGKGVFIYTGLAFFRQLPAGVAGAYRLLANLLAL